MIDRKDKLRRVQIGAVLASAAQADCISRFNCIRLFDTESQKREGGRHFAPVDGVAKELDNA